MGILGWLKKLLFFGNQINNKGGAPPPCYYLFFLQCVCHLFAVNSFTQSLHDNIWIVGYGGEGAKLDFAIGSLEISSFDIDLFYRAANVSMCDSVGNLLFYSNGTYIADGNNQLMTNGDGFIFGELAASSGNGVNVPQIIVALPLPENSNYYYLLYKALTVDENGMNPESHIYYAVIDMALNNGLGEVVEKNKVVFEGVYLDWGEMTACRHANGRDWWIIQGTSDSNHYYKFLLTPSGISLQGEQAIGIDVPSGLGQAAFSPNGTKYARLNMVDYQVGNFIDIYDFNRCDGLLSNHIQINYADTAFAGGLAFSPNSRFLYVASTNYLYQFDTWASDFPSSKQVVGIYDGFQSPLWTSFYLCQLAPNNKIYINAPNGVDVMHVINKPDEKGLACDFQQHSIQLPAINAFSMPNFPYFRLGALEGSPCDTIGVSAVHEAPVKYNVEVSPNPASDWLTIRYDGPFSADLSLVIFNTNGMEVERVDLNEASGSQVVSIQNLANGLYFCKILDNDRTLLVNRVAIMR